MKKLFLILMLAIVAMAGMAQTIGDAFYIYRNDGQFNAFFRAEVDSIVYSNYDADSVYYDEIVTQLVYTQDSVYWIPLASVDSVGFVQPETILNSDVFLLTAEHSPYISEADTIHFIMSVATPQELLPHKGNIVVATADCEAFVDGIVARVEGITNTENGILYQCSMVGIDEVFEQLVVFSQTVSGNGDDVSESRLFNPKRASITSVLWDREWSRTIEGGGTSTTVNASDRAVVTVTARKTLTTPFFFQLEMENTMRAGIDFTAKSTVRHYEQRQIGTTISVGKITIPYTMGLLWFTPKLSLYGYFQEEGKVELRYAGHISRTDKVTFTYTEGKWQFNHAPLNEASTDIAQLSMDGYAEVGLRPQVDFSLNGRKAGFGFSASVGLREYINFIFDITKLSDGGLYDAMRDSYCRTTIPWSLTAHASADIFSQYDSDFSDTGFATFSYTFEPANELQWGNDRYIFPLFSDVSANRDKSDKTKVEAESHVSRSPLLPVQVGFSLLDKDKNILQTKYDSRIYSDSSLFPNYKGDFSGLKVSGEYSVRPSVKIFDHDVLASPSVEIDAEKEVSVHTLSAYNTQTSSAVVRGRVDDFVSGQDDGEVGFFYNKTGNPTIGNAQGALAGRLSSSTNGEFLYTISGLNDGTTYYYCAYLLQNGEYKYGEVLSFTTMKAPDPDPVAITGASYNVKTTTATISCTYENVSGGAECGYYLQSQGSGRTFYSVGNMEGSKTINLSNLKPSTTYYYTAAIKNNNREFTGAERSFTTEKEKEPKATTGDYSSVTKNSAVVTCSFENVPDGASCYVFLQWNENGIDKMVTYNASAGVNQRISCTNLKPSTTYYYAAAIKYNNNEYIGAERSFTTEKEKEPKATTGDYSDVTTNSAIVTCSFEDVPDGASCYVFLQWEENGSYNMVTYNASPGVNQRITCTNLKSSTTYYYTATIKYGNEEYTGEERSFTTKAGETSCPDSNHPHWIDLGLPSGTQWRCCNEGASTPEAYGGYYQFGQVSSAPTYAQIQELLSNCTYQWTTQNGINGGKFTGSNGGTLFFPAAGGRWNSDLLSAGSLGYYWSSALNESYPGNAYYLTFGSGHAHWNYANRYYGLSVRPVR